MATSILSSPLPLLPIISLLSVIALPLTLHASSLNPFTAGAATIRYWNRKIPNNSPHPDFFLSLISPLPASLSSSLPSPLSITPDLCLSARLLCPNSTFFEAPSSKIPTDNILAFYKNELHKDNRKYFYTSEFRKDDKKYFYMSEFRKDDKKYFYTSEFRKDDNFEPGIYFRESELKEGNVMPMSNIRNKKPVRSFLPRSIADRIPFESEAIKFVFALEPDTALADIVDKTMARCQMPPSPGETKRCITSAEDMIDFAVDMLGDDIVMRSTKSSNGSGGPIMIGKINKINGGKVTRSISCHQHLFPYMVYHCHSVPKIRVYEAEILSVETKEKINTGVAICHLDTSMWNPKHLAFVQAGGKPGETEVCHWISNGDLAWVVADHDPNDQFFTNY